MVALNLSIQFIFMVWVKIINIEQLILTAFEHLSQHPGSAPDANAIYLVE